MKRWMLLILLCTTACSAPLQTPDVQPVNSGVEGQVLIGPMCPVMRVDNPCPPEPYETTLIVRNPHGDDLLEIQTDAEGKFRASLPPGEYILHPTTPDNQPLPRAEDVPFTVTENQFTQLTVEYDSGIR